MKNSHLLASVSAVLVVVSGCAATKDFGIRPLDPAQQSLLKAQESSLAPQPIAPQPIIDIKPIPSPTPDAKPSAGPLNIAPAWNLREGQMVGKEIQNWAKNAGWKVIWQLPKDWFIPASTTFSGDFKAAASEVITTLAANGILIRAQFFDGNKTMVVTGPGVVEQ